MTEIIPTIIADTFGELEKKIRAIEPHAAKAHIDIMDGLFVPHKTIDGPDEIDKLQTALELEIHLMVQKPENKIVRWLQTRAGKFIVHRESTKKFIDIINFVREKDGSIFACLNPETPSESLAEIINEIDGVQFMTVNPGSYGAKFLKEIVPKISDFHYFYPDMAIEVDGGITPATAPGCLTAGASIFAVGSYIFESKDIDQAIRKLKEVL